MDGFVGEPPLSPTDETYITNWSPPLQDNWASSVYWQAFIIFAIVAVYCGAPWVLARGRRRLCRGDFYKRNDGRPPGQSRDPWMSARMPDLF